jgi:hypothetical protein
MKFAIFHRCVFALKMEAIRFPSEMLVTTYKITRCHNPAHQDRSLNLFVLHLKSTNHILFDNISSKLINSNYCVYGHRIAGVTGSVMLNGQERNLNSFKRLSCYITQDDRLQPLLTVSENMKIAADLKLGEHVSTQDKNGTVSIISNLFCVSTKLGFSPYGKNKDRQWRIVLGSDDVVMIPCRFVGWRWRQYVSPKCLYLPTSPHGVTAQKNIIIIIIAARKSNLTKTEYSRTKLAWNRETDARRRTLHNDELGKVTRHLI